jgi:hypothetical protein
MRAVDQNCTIRVQSQYGAHHERRAVVQEASTFEAARQLLLVLQPPVEVNTKCIIIIMLQGENTTCIKARGSVDSGIENQSCKIPLYNLSLVLSLSRN